jgi:hypothetical protein
MAGTLSPQTISTKQLELAQRAEQYPHEVLLTLSHFIDLDWLREAYRRTRKDDAAGVDGQSAAQYQAQLTKPSLKKTCRDCSTGSNQGVTGRRR